MRYIKGAIILLALVSTMVECVQRFGVILGFLLWQAIWSGAVTFWALTRLLVIYERVNSRHRDDE